MGKPRLFTIVSKHGTIIFGLFMFFDMFHDYNTRNKTGKRQKTQDERKKTRMTSFLT